MVSGETISQCIDWQNTTGGCVLIGTVLCLSSIVFKIVLLACQNFWLSVPVLFTSIEKLISVWNTHLKPPGDIQGIPGQACKPYFNASLFLTLLPFFHQIIFLFLIRALWFPLPDCWWWQKQKGVTVTIEICCYVLSPTDRSPNTPRGDGQDGWGAEWQQGDKGAYWWK